MMHVILAEGLEDREFIERRTESFDEVRSAASGCFARAGFADHRCTRRGHTDRARMYAGAKGAAIVYAMGITQHSTGTDNVLSWPTWP